MRARKLGYIVAACSPIFLLALIGINGNFLTFPSNIPEYGTEVNNDILNYRIPVALANSLDATSTDAKEELIFAVAEAWIAAHEQGMLNDIPPACGLDDGMQCVREEIDTSKRNLLLHLARVANVANDRQDYETSAKASIAMLKIAPINKYTSSLGINLATKTEYTTIAYLESAYDLLSPGTQQKVQATLSEISADSNRVTHLFEHFTALEKAHPYSPSEQVFTHVTLDTLINSPGRTLVSLSENNRQVQVLNSFKIAFERENRLAQELHEAKTRYGISNNLVAKN